MSGAHIVVGSIKHVCVHQELPGLRNCFQKEWIVLSKLLRYWQQFRISFEEEVWFIHQQIWTNSLLKSTFTTIWKMIFLIVLPGTFVLTPRYSPAPSCCWEDQWRTCLSMMMLDWICLGMMFSDSRDHRSLPCLPHCSLLPAELRTVSCWVPSLR